MTDYRIGVDIGGTFTDIVLLTPDGDRQTRKVLSTPDDYSRGILQGLSDLLQDDAGDRRGGHAYSPEGCREVVHGTTVATNAILENRGARTGLLTTRGFRDVLELRRLRTPALYDLRFRPPAPMVERSLRLEVAERIGPGGEVLEPLDEESVRCAIVRLCEAGVSAVAVTLLHSYRNPTHERRIGELIREAMPEVFLSLSVDVLPEIREYERTSTTVINAYVGPIVRSYLESLERRLRGAGISGPLKIMESSGGTMSARAASERPAHIVESGPAAGTIAARATGEVLGIEDLIAFDMGGTTAKATLIEDGKVNLTSEYEVGTGISLSSRLIKGGGHALRLPMLDIAEVGAGGGSIVWVDRGGALKVGPRSAGATPGPACYGLGGRQPTVTDANVVLGYLNPHHLAGGALALRPELAQAALDEVARSLGQGAAGPGDAVAEVAHGVHVVANATMIRAIKAVTTYRGRDPRDFTLLAFGGSGPLHALAIARELGIARVVVPPDPGVFSAFGLLQAPPEAHTVQTFVRGTEDVDPEELARVYEELEARARAMLIRDGYAESDIHLDRHADLRYVGQAYELTVPAGGGAPDRESLRRLAERFGQEHERMYGHRAEHEPVELVNVRVVGVVRSSSFVVRSSSFVVRSDNCDSLDGSQQDARDISDGAEPQVVTPRASNEQQTTNNEQRPTTNEQRTTNNEQRTAYFSPNWLQTPVIGRDGLGAEPRDGPLIVEDYDSTTVIPPGCRARLIEGGSILVDVGAA